jgi:glutaredoxin 3
MAKVEMFIKPMCPYCIRAKALLDKKGVEVSEYNAFMNADHRKAMLQRANGARTYPQIFINDQHVGGCDDLRALDSAGKLDPMLAG